MTLWYICQAEFPKRKGGLTALAALLLTLAAVGCHPFPQVYPGRGAVGPFPSEQRGSLREWEEPAAREDEDAVRNHPSAPLGHIKPVGYTQKSFGDMAQDENRLPPTSGAVQWSDAPMQIGESDPSSPSDTSLPLVQDLSAYQADSGDSDSEDALIDSIVSSAPLSKGNVSSNPMKAALADSIQHPKAQSIADITFLPETSADKAPVPISEAAEGWRGATQRAIALLKEEIDRRARAGEICAAEEARLRLLLLTTGNIPGAAEKIAGMDPNLQLFWERECRGLGRFIETQETASDAGGEKSAWMETLPDFQEGVRALKTGMPLAVRKSLFVKEPSVFGYYEEVPGSFAPGGTVNAYFELDNVVCKPSEGGNGCDISVLCRRELVDSLNRNVVETKEKLCEGHSASPLNDIVLNLSVSLPERIPAGTYTLRTVFLDRNSDLSRPVTHTMEIRVD